MSLWAGGPQEPEGWRLSPPPVVTAVLINGVDCWGKACPVSSVMSLTTQASPVFAGMSSSFSSFTYLFTSLPLPCLHIPPSHFFHSSSHSWVHSLFPFILSLTGPSTHPSTHLLTHLSAPSSTHPPSIHHTATHALTRLSTPSSIQQMFSVGVNLPHTQALHATSGCLPSLPPYLPVALMKEGSSSQVPGMTGIRTVVGFLLDPKVVSRCGSWVLILSHCPWSCVALNLALVRFLWPRSLLICVPASWSFSPLPSCHHLGCVDDAPTSGFFISLTGHLTASPLKSAVPHSHHGPQCHLELLSL